MTLQRFFSTALSIALITALSDAAPQKDRSVIVISLDGFPAYALEDPRLPVPTLRRLMHEGAWARAMQPVNPSVTWPNHTTMVTGLFPRDHGLLYNSTAFHKLGTTEVRFDESVPKSEMVHTATVYDIAHQAGLTTAQVDWVAINKAATIDWAFPEKAAPADPLVQEMVSKGALRMEDIAEEPHRTVLWLDQIWTKAATYIIREHKPNLLLMHLLALDTTNHSYGPKTLASNDAMAFLDGCVAQVVEAVRASGMAERTTFLIVSDHGFTAVKKHIQMGTILKAGGLSDKVRAVPEGGSAMFYVKAEDRAATLASLRDIFGKLDGVAKIADQGEFASLGLPDPQVDSQMADMVIYSQPGYSFSNGGGDGPFVADAAQVSGAHGFLNTQPEMNAIFIASGLGIRGGVVLDPITNRRVAPTIARLLGISLPRSEEGALTEILR